MGHYHINHPDNGKNYARHTCARCGRRRFEKFLDHFLNRGGLQEWRCWDYNTCAGLEMRREEKKQVKQNNQVRAKTWQR